MTSRDLDRITATGVLGEFDYDIAYPHDENHRLRLVYAENGRGKTNLLRAVGHLLTPSVDSLQSLIEIPIHRLRIDFRGGSYLEMVRQDLLSGSFVAVAGDGEETFSIEVDPADFAGRLHRRVWDERTDYQNYLSAARAMSRGAVFIGDDRLSPLDEREVTRNESVAARRRAAGSVSRLLERVAAMLTRTVMDGMSYQRRGGGVYSDLTKTTLRGRSSKLDASQARRRLELLIRKILTEGSALEKYRLLNLGQLRDIQQQLQAARSNNRNLPTLLHLLAPYLESLEGQIDSLTESHKLIDTYIESVNFFLDRKHMKFAIAGGISLVGHDGVVLNPESLSSGEKHLLVLLSHAMLATEERPLVILDEPEISLGLEWQRALLQTLLDCSSSASVQFLVASHSVQVMAGIGEIVRPTESARG